MTSDFKGFLYPILSITFFVLSLFLEKEPALSFSMLCAQQGNYWYHFYNVFGMTRSLTGDWTRDLPHSMPALDHLGYRGGGSSFNDTISLSPLKLFSFIITILICECDIRGNNSHLYNSEYIIINNTEQFKSMAPSWTLDITLVNSVIQSADEITALPG